MRVSNSKIWLCAIFCLISEAYAQTRGKDKYLDITVSPSIGFRVLGAYTVAPSFPGSKKMYHDSLNRADRPGQSINLGIQYMVKRSASTALSVGLSYTTLAFRRVQDSLELGDWVHPQVGYVVGLIQAPILSVKYDFRYRYIEASMLWYGKGEGRRKIKDLDLWFFGGFSPALLVRDRVHIFTQGFTMNGTNTFDVKDKEVTGVFYNLFLQAGYRMDYYLYKNIHGLLQPRLRIPLLPSSQGTQTVWIPQFSLDIGLIFLLSKRK